MTHALKTHLVSARWPIAHGRALALFCTVLLPLASPAQGPNALGVNSGVEAGVADTKKTGTLPPMTTELSKKAARALSKRDWKTARTAYEEILKEDPTNALTRANLGVVEFQSGNLDAARSHLESAVATRPQLSRCWTTLGLVYLRQDDALRAVSALSRSVAEDATSPEAHNHLAVAAKALGWNSAAELHLQKAISLRPAYAEAHFNLALVFLDRRPPSLELARRHYKLSQDLGAAPDSLVEKQLKGETP